MQKKLILHKRKIDELLYNRMQYYIALINELNILSIKKKQLIRSYNISIMEIDKEIEREKCKKQKK